MPSRERKTVSGNVAPVDHAGTAFPLVMRGEETHIQEGLTIRDYFAAKAMQAIVGSFGETNTNMWERRAAGIIRESSHSADDAISGFEAGDDFYGCHDKRIAESAFRIADAMIAQRRRAVPKPNNFLGE